MLAGVVQSLSHVQLLETKWTLALQASLSMGFSRQEYWSGFPFLPDPGDLPDPGIEPASPSSPALQTDSLPCKLPGKPLINSLLYDAIGEGHGNPLQYSCLENPMDREAW